jgi:hypothetical protein
MTDSTRPTPGSDNDQTTPVNTTPPPRTTPMDTTPMDTTPLDTTPLTSTPMAPAAEPLPRRRPLFPTILWGAMMLALAAYFAAGELVPGGFDPVTWFLTAVVGIGLLLVVAGIAAASRRAG